MRVFTSFLAAISIMAGAQAFAEDVIDQEQQRLSQCLKQIDEEPVEAYEDSLQWMTEGARPYARYCTALALVALGKAADGAAQLEALANATDGGTIEDRAIYLAQSGNAWLVGGYPEAAIVTLTNALKLSKSDPEVYKDRARAYLAAEQWANGEGDLTEAISMQPGDFDSYYLRAEARFQQNKLLAAMRDVVQARGIDPENIDVLLLRGRIRQAEGEAAGEY